MSQLDLDAKVELAMEAFEEYPDLDGLYLCFDNADRCVGGDSADECPWCYCVRRGTREQVAEMIRRAELGN